MSWIEMKKKGAESQIVINYIATKKVSVGDVFNTLFFFILNISIYFGNKFCMYLYNTST